MRLFNKDNQVPILMQESVIKTDLSLLYRGSNLISTHYIHAMEMDFRCIERKDNAAWHS